jgi:hypothetical protein
LFVAEQLSCFFTSTAKNRNYFQNGELRWSESKQKQLLEGKTVSEISGHTKALTVIPKNEMAIVARKEGAKAAKLQKTKLGFIVGTFSGMVVTFGGLVMAAPVVVPIVAMAGVAFTVGNFFVGLLIEAKEFKARNRQAKAIEERRNCLVATARTALEGAIADGTIHAEQDLCITPQDETPKKIHVEKLRAIITTINANSEQTLSIVARILEEDGRPVDWMEDYDRVSLERPVAAFPKAIPESIRIEALPAETTAEPLAAREPEKKLPRIDIPLSLGG